MKTKVAENGRKLRPHDCVAEWSVCGKCGSMIDWASEGIDKAEDDTSCPFCGSEDTDWLYAQD